MMNRIKKNVCPILVGMLATFTAYGSVKEVDAAKPRLSILPKGIQYDPGVPAPQDTLGFQIGTRHVRHHELVNYMTQLAEASDRVAIHTYANSYGNRPLIHVTITSPRNHARLEQIRKQHQTLADPLQSARVEIDELPAVINMGYSVHGDESSAGNAATLVAYYLAAGLDDKVEQLLDEVVVLVDPCLNPDGFDRFAAWANSHRGQIVNADRNHLEHNQPFPGGRVNYYWFDLNRDWLPAQHPESQGRLKEYFRWMPNVVLDFHEMSSDSTFFFQPGIQIRTNPLTPAANQKLTFEMARYHAEALDQIGSMYYTEERYDDFYVGKGSAYPDLHGAVGILFEQASSRGLAVDTRNGTLEFPTTIKNQFTTSLSSLDAVQAMREKLLQHKRKFYRDSLQKGKEADVKGYAFVAVGDEERLEAFATILDRHQIEMSMPEKEMEIDGRTLKPGEVIVVRNDQPEHLFLQSLLSRQTSFPENVFYDVSTWTLPLAFNLEQIELTQMPGEKELRPFRPGRTHTAKRSKRKDAKSVAYLIDWRSLSSPRLLQQLLEQGVKVRVARESFQAETADGVKEFGYGTLLVHLGTQTLPRRSVRRIVRELKSPQVHATQSGLTIAGIDLGSDAFAVVKTPKLLLLVGDGVSRYEAGEVWHQLDQQVRMPLTMVTAEQLAGLDLNDYTTVVFVSGTHSNVSNNSIAKLKGWLSQGGTLVAIGSGCEWVERQKLVSSPITLESSKEDSSNAEDKKGALQLPFASARKTQALQLISGAIFEARVDPSHPIGYGITTATVPLFRNNRIFLAPSKNLYANPAIYTDEPQMSGYCSAENVEMIKRSAAIVIRSNGQGRVVLMSDNPNFRAFWYGSNRLFINSIFFGHLMKTP